MKYSSLNRADAYQSGLVGSARIGACHASIAADHSPRQRAPSAAISQAFRPDVPTNAV
jgi:hypothetical protein